MHIGEAKSKASAAQDRPIFGRPRARRAGRAGFTLTEIMIAMGVLAVGMGMVAGALHAGIEVHIRTIDDIMRQLIADNALAIVQARIPHSDTNGIGETLVCVSDPASPDSNLRYFGANDLRYPLDDPNTPYGAVVFMKANQSNHANDYRVLVVPYRIVTAATAGSPGNVTVDGMAGVTTANSGDGSRITNAPANKLSVGMPVIDTDGNVAIVTSTPNNTSAITDVRVTGTTLTTLKAQNSTDRVECSKPIRTDTALSPPAL